MLKLTMLSAPLLISLISPSGVLTIIDILFLELVNSITLRTLKVRLSPLLVVMVTSSGVLSINLWSYSIAPSTRAFSSGLAALYRRLPSSFS